MTNHRTFTRIIPRLAALTVILGLGTASPAQENVRPPSTETSFRLPASQPPRAPQSETSYMLRTPGTETRYSIDHPAPITSGDPQPVRVALFADPVSTQEESVDAMWDLLSRSQDIAVDKVTTPTVRSDNFMAEYDVLILPGGTATGEARAIGVDAGNAIAKSIRDGKGLVAVCAGGYYVVEGWTTETAALDLINAQNHDGRHWARGTQFIAVEVTGASDGNTSRTIWYENGPIFKPADIEGLPGYVSLVKYVTDLAAKDAPTGQMAGRDAVIAAPYGEGRVVAFGPHPELTPDLNHWLINAIKWAARRHGVDQEITSEIVLEGRQATPPSVSSAAPLVP